jgi:hypothetical protein
MKVGSKVHTTAVEALEQKYLCHRPNSKIFPIVYAVAMEIQFQQKTPVSCYGDAQPQEPHRPGGSQYFLVLGVELLSYHPSGV